MSRTRDSLIWGAILIIVGLLFLLWNFGVFDQFSELAELIIAGLFALVGLGFLVGYVSGPQDWWKLIPGFALLSVGGIVYLGSRDVTGVWIGALLFAGIALPFAVIYLGDRQERWWALIPFGAMLVMVVIVLLSTMDWAEETLGAVLFGGMGLVFLLVYALAKDRRQFRWALIPMAVLLVMALVALSASIVQTAPNLAQLVRFWPILLVIGGVLLLGASLSRSSKDSPPPARLPAQPAPSEQPAAPGASVSVVPEDLSARPSQRVERSPIVLVESVPAGSETWQSGEQEEAQPAAEKKQSEAASDSGEVPDIYKFLKNGPPS